MLKPTRIDATTGPIVPQIIRYALPLILTTLVQNLFNAVDLMVLGNLADSNAVASVGATSSSYAMMITLFVSFSAGIRVLLSRFVGERSAVKVKQSVDTAIILALGLGIVAAVGGYFLSPRLLRWIDCPEECYEGAVLYLRIYIGAAPAILMYNFTSGILSVAGNTKSPLYYMVAGGVVNVLLNIILCLILPNKVAAVAISTAASSSLGAVLCLRRLHQGEGIVKWQPRNMQWSTRMCGKIVAQGIPIGLTDVLYPLANLQIQAAVNSFGVAAVAGGGGASPLEHVAASFIAGINTTTGVFIGQNLGAEKHDRVRKSFFHSLWLNTAVGTVIGVFLASTSRFWMRFFLPNDPEAVEYAVMKTWLITAFYGIAGINGVLNYSIRSFGYALYSSIASMVCVFGVRMVWVNFIYPISPTYRWLMTVYPVTWILTTFALTAIFVPIYVRYCHGKYKRL
jgi:putative MATE family efflux protein